MVTTIRNWVLAASLGFLAACGGGGGGDSAAGVQPGPTPPGGPVTPPPPNQPAPLAPYAQAQTLLATITGVTLDAQNRPLVEWQLTDGSNTAIVDLEAGDVRFTAAKLQASPLGSLTGNWQSYINQIEQPGVGPGTEPRLQATYERNADTGVFTNNGDGSYSYRFAQSLSQQPADITAQAAAENINLDFEPQRTHRIAMQFDNAPGKVNPYYDWQPSTGATAPLFSMDIAATANCNLCHDPLAIHGGGRLEVEYCVTCHNAGSTDANSGNSVDMKAMIHKIHRGAALPSVVNGGEYSIYGFRDSKHDYSQLVLPMDIRNCENCHAGTATGTDGAKIQTTAQGDNWAQVPSQAACGSCHDDVVFSAHAGGQSDDLNCASCHSVGGVAGSIEDNHRQLAREASQRFVANIVRVEDSMPGQSPVVTFDLRNPAGEPYDLLNDPVFSGASVNVRTSWDTRDYTNTGNGSDSASSISASALSAATDNGDGTYSVTMPEPIPNGATAPFIAASGSGAVTIEGRLNVVLEEGEMAQRVPLINTHAFFSIDEPDGEPVARRQSVELESCLDCHGSLSIHGDNRTDSIDSCVTCHNPRNTDREVRAIASTPPTDGKDEESLHFKTMIHAIHAASVREEPLQVVGFRGFNTYVYDEEHVHYPGDLANCAACHTDDGFTLPLPASALATTVDTGADHASPTDDTVVTAATAACYSCHDGTEAKAHMTLQGGSFSTTQAAIDSGEVVETCTVCHGPGSDADVETVHRVHDKPL